MEMGKNRQGLNQFVVGDLKIYKKLLNLLFIYFG